VIIDWWNLPGPNSLVARICSEIRTGKNVVLAIPHFFPEGIRQAVRDSQELRDHLAWHTLNVPASDSRHPLDWLWEEFVFADNDPGQIRSVELLLERNVPTGMVVWVDGLQHSCPTTLPVFLERFSQALNGIAVYKRFQICCVVPLSSIKTFSANVCCAVIDSTSYVGGIDALTYASTLVEDQQLNLLDAQVAASVVANLALWDQELAAGLAREPLETIFSPTQWLYKWGKEKRLNTGMNSEQCRHLGLLTVFDGQPKLHSAVAAMRGSTSEINARVWRGQASVLLPFIEERRRELLEYLGSLIFLPFRTPYGDITDVNDLEIGHLYSIFGRGYRVDSNVQDLIRVLRDMRNKLAHFSPIDYRMMASREVRGFHSILTNGPSSEKAPA
jgi:hypothetical protein